MPRFRLVPCLLASFLLLGAASAQTTASPPPPGATTAYVPSPEVAEQVRQRVLGALREQNPEMAVRLDTIVKQRDLRDVWAETVAADGLHPDDVADAVASDWVLNWMIVHGRTDNTTAQVQGTRRQVAGALLANTAFRRLDDAGRQAFAETNIYDFVLQYVAFRDAVARHDPVLLRRLADFAQARMERDTRLDLRRLVLTDEGLRSEAAAGNRASPAPVPRFLTAPEQGLNQADIARVTVAQGIGITADGLANQYDVFLLLRDGTVFHDPEVAPADLDVTASRAGEPARWGRWDEGSGGITFTWPDAGGPRTERKAAGELATCRPAEPGLTLDGEYTHAGADGPVVPGGTVTPGGADLLLRRDGSFAQASAAPVNGGVQAPRAAGQYRLNGYTIELDRDGTAPDRRFFCRYADNDAAVFIGRTPWLVRNR